MPLAEDVLGDVLGLRCQLVGDEVPELDSSSSPTGFSSETGVWCCADLVDLVDRQVELVGDLLRAGP